jgi:hypothetical protein
MKTLAVMKLFPRPGFLAKLSPRFLAQLAQPRSREICTILMEICQLFPD